jgi:hypothetical protein
MDLHKNDGSGHHFSLHKDKLGKTFVTFLDSDGCIAIARPAVSLPCLPQSQPILDWSLGPDKRTSLQGTFKGATRGGELRKFEARYPHDYLQNRTCGCVGCLKCPNLRFSATTHSGTSWMLEQWSSSLAVYNLVGAANGCWHHFIGME